MPRSAAPSFPERALPAVFHGGYEIACRAVAERLEAFGHDVRLLTSNYGLSGARQSAEHWTGPRAMLTPWLTGRQSLTTAARELVVAEFNIAKTARRMLQLFGGRSA